MDATLNEVTLADIANDEANRDKKLTFAVIIDVSEPFRVEGQDDYTVKFKVIDPTFNYKAFIENPEIKFRKFATIYVYAHFVTKVPKVKFVGEILRLRRFNFVINERGELHGHMNNYSNWLAYPGRKGSRLNTISAKDYAVNVDRELTSGEKETLSGLRDWSYDFFQNNSIKSVGWTNELVEPVSEKAAADQKLEAKNVDLIIKVIKVIREKKCVEFVDHMSKRYLLFLEATPVLNVDDVIKIRCIDIQFKPEGRVINLTKFSSCLIVPEHYLDASLFLKNAKISPMLKTPSKYTPRRSGKATPLVTKRVATVAYPFLEEFEYEDYLIENPDLKKNTGVQSKKTTLIKKRYKHRVPTPISELFEILEDPQEYDHQRFVISGYIMGFSQMKMDKIVRKLNIDSKKVHGFNEKTSVSDNIRYIYHFIMYMRDSSVEGSKKTLNTYVLTNDGNQHLFDLWDLLPQPEEVTQWENIQRSDVKAFESKFKALKNVENKVELVVELLITDDGRPFFKLFDTIFLP